MTGMAVEVARRIDREFWMVVVISWIFTVIGSQVLGLAWVGMAFVLLMVLVWIGEAWVGHRG